MRKWSMGLMALCLTALLITPVFAALPSGTGKITNCNHVSGSEFSSKSSIAKKLDKMFAGNIGLYKDKNKTTLVDASLGTRNVPNNGVYQYWGPTPRAGTSCFAYANAFYGHFYDGVYPHHSLNSNHKVIKATGKITYANFVKWGVRDDAAVYIREGNHSIIVLTYDKNYITYVDGNGDGKGLIAIRKEAWTRGTGANIYNQKPSLIVQPTTKYFPKGSMKGQGSVSCAQGGNSHDWDKGVVTKEATCRETGLKVTTCLDCGLSKEETIAKTTNHTYGEWAVTQEATCAAKGKKTAQCAVCGKEKSQTIKALGHKYGKAVVTQKGGTIGSPAITEKTCERCGKVQKTKSDCVAQYEDFGITLTAKEGVFSKKTELAVTTPGDPEVLQIILKELTASTYLFLLDARVEDKTVQPSGTVTLELQIPEAFGSNLGLYQITNGRAKALEGAVDPETRVLTAQLQSCGIFALCDLDIPYEPEPAEDVTEPATEPVTEPITEPVTQPVTQPVTEPIPAPTAVAQERGVLRQMNQEWILWAALAAVPVACGVTILIAFVVGKIRNRKGKTPTQAAEEPAEETPTEEAEITG